MKIIISAYLAGESSLWMRRRVLHGPEIKQGEIVPLFSFNSVLLHTVRSNTNCPDHKYNNWNT